jgi:hypothetical protein
VLPSAAECCENDRVRLAELVAGVGWNADDERIAAIRRMTKRDIKLKLAEIIRVAQRMARPGTYRLSAAAFEADNA